MSISDFMAKHKITIGLVGTTVVITTVYGSCQFSPLLVEEQAPEVSEEVPEEPPVPGTSDEEQIEEEEEAAENQPIEE